MINEKISIEELLELLPASVTYLSEQGIKCIACGEPIWGTLEDAAREKGYGNNEIQSFVDELNTLMNKNQHPNNSIGR